MTELGSIILAPDGSLHTVIAINEAGRLVTVIRRGAKLDIYQDFLLTDRESPPPHWTATRPRVAQRVCVECGGRWYSGALCRRCHAQMGGRLRSEGQKRRRANGQFERVQA